MGAPVVTAEAFHTSWDKVCDAVTWVVDWGLEHRSLDGIRAIGVDEIQYSKGHKYLTLVYQIDERLTRLLWIGRERTVASFEGFFTTIGDELAAKIEFVCSDIWKPYLRVIQERCSQALHILDRFHIVAQMNKALDEVRTSEARRMAQDGHIPLLKKTRSCLLKRIDNLSEQQSFRLRDLLAYNLRTVRAYLIKEDFQRLWDFESPIWAGRFLDLWCRAVMRSRIKPMKKVARTLRSHRELILNYFEAKKRFSSGVVEGLNKKAKVTMRKIVRLPHLRRPRSRPVSLTWQASRASGHPRILLTTRKLLTEPEAESIAGNWSDEALSRLDYPWSQPKLTGLIEGLVLIDSPNGSPEICDLAVLPDLQTRLRQNEVLFSRPVRIRIELHNVRFNRVEGVLADVRLNP